MCLQVHVLVLNVLLVLALHAIVCLFFERVDARCPACFRRQMHTVYAFTLPACFIGRVRPGVVKCVDVLRALVRRGPLPRF